MSLTAFLVALGAALYVALALPANDPADRHRPVRMPTLPPARSVRVRSL